MVGAEKEEPYGWTLVDSEQVQQVDAPPAANGPHAAAVQLDFWLVFS